MDENQTLTWDLTTIPTAKLLDMLHDYQQAYEFVSGKDYEHTNQAHHVAHFHNMRYAVARELERRGLGGLQPLEKSLAEAIWEGVEDIVERWGTFSPRAVQWLSKAVELKANERWITVHPHGSDEGGVPVLIRDNPDGSSHIIGGAGGSMNYVKLTNLKSPEAYKEHAKQQATVKRGEEKARKEGMTPEAKEMESIANAGLDDRKREQQIRFVKQVYSALGHDVPEFTPLEQIVAATGVDMASAKIARSREIRAHVSGAKLAVKMAQEAVMNDHELAAQAGLGDISLGKTSDKDLFGEGQAGIDLLTSDKANEGAGIEAGFKERAAAQGVTPEQIKEEGKLVRERAHQGASGEQEAASHSIAERVQHWNRQAKDLEKQGVVKAGVLKEPKVPPPDQIMDVLKAERDLRKVEQDVKKKKGEVKRGVEVNPFVVDTKDTVEADVVKEFKDEISVKAARSLLGMVEKEEGLNRHVRAGAFDALNEAGLTITANEMLPREAIDFLGSAGAAQVLAAKLKAQLSPEEFADVSEAVETFHGRTNTEAATTAVDTAKKHLEAAKKIELETVSNPVDIVAARTLNEKRLEHLEQAREVLGTAYGRVSAMGELALAMRGAKEKPGPVKVDMGEAARESAVTMARSFGLTPDVSDIDVEKVSDPTSHDYVDLEKVGGASGGGDYVIDSSGGHTFITLNPSSFGKLVSDFDPQQERAYRAAQDIKAGSKDEEGWLPAGIERRPETTFRDPNYSLARFDNTINLTPESTPEHLNQTMQDFVGAQVSEGYDLDDLRTDLYSPEFKAAHVPEHLHGEYDKVREDLFPLPRLSADEKKLPFKQRSQILTQRTEELKQGVQARAQEFSEAYKQRHGMTDEDLVALNTQRIPIVPEQTHEAIHRTLSAIPESKTAFTPLGELDHEGKSTLREYFLRNVAGIQPTAKTEKPAAAEAKPAEEKPKAKQINIFGEAEDVDEEKEYALSHPEQAGAAEEETPETKAWNGYVKALGGQQEAYRTLQGIVRGEAVKEYARHHGRVFGKPLKVGTARLPNWEKHLIGRLPEEKMKAALGSKYEEAQRLMATLAKRSGGKFAKEGEEGARKQAAERLQSLMKETQLGLFQTDQFPKLDRPTIGNDAEKQLASVWGKVADSFGKKQKVDLIPDLSMSGDKVKQQRAVKLITQNKRLGLHFGAGSGKSLISIGAFTQLHSEGKAKKAVYAVPSAVLGQFGSEMLRFTTPGRYKWLADPTASREDRFAAYKDPDTHMVVTTHQSFRDDIIHAVAGHRGVTAAEAGDWFEQAPKEVQRQAVKDAMDHHGWNTDFLAVDEAHGILNREGKPDSAMANTIDAFSSHMPNYVSMTGTPVKNDASEAFDVLAKLDPQKFTDQKAFMRKYGVNTGASKRALQRLMAQHVYTDRIPSGVNRNTEVRTVPLMPKQQEEYDRVRKALNILRATRKGGADIEAAMVLAPDAFAGKPEEQRQEIADRVAQTGLGGRLQHRLNHVVNAFDYEHNAKIQALRADLTKDAGKPHVIFAHNYASIDQIQKLCKDMGLRVGVVSGRKNSAEKMAAREGFQGDKFDVLINSDAGATGQNLQRGTVLVNYDTPDTAMTHEQRIARIDRIGQKNDVTVRDYTTDTPIERRARKRLADKYQLADVFQSPSELLDDSGLASEIQAVRAKKRDQLKRAA